MSTAGKRIAVAVTAVILGLGGLALSARADDPGGPSGPGDGPGMAGPPPAAAFDGPGGPQMHRGFRPEMDQRRPGLDLTDAQRQKIKSILDSHKDQIVQTVQATLEKRQALHDATAAANPDEKAIRAAADDLGRALGDEAVLTAKTRQEILPVLSDTQRQQLGQRHVATDRAVEQFFHRILEDQ
ncbi:MAG: Spy/CpxP family protein refolding chaperone [Tepidisphaeraceae bacterium]|jgi:Spy/CpxP family protein refolding chaperone